MSSSQYDQSQFKYILSFVFILKILQDLSFIKNWTKKDNN